VLRVGLVLASVVLSWAMVHTIYALRYAHLYYDGTDCGIDFNDSGRPTYADFAYLAFTIGMTFQVSDTVLTSQQIGRTALSRAAVVPVRHRHRRRLDQPGGKPEQQLTLADPARGTAALAGGIGLASQVPPAAPPQRAVRVIPRSHLPAAARR
jgi:hypothetical protein